MFELLKRSLAGSFQVLFESAQAAKTKADEIYQKLITAVLFLIVIVIVMWLLNVLGGKGINFFFFYIGVIGIVFFLLIPQMHIYAALLGMTVAELKDKDLSLGAVEGITKLHKVVLAVLLGFMLVSGALATWSFQNSPSAFFPILAMILILTLMSAVFGLKGRTIPITLISAYAVCVIAASVWSTVPQSVKSKLSKNDGHVIESVPSSRRSDEYSKQEVAVERFSIPAMGTIRIPRSGNCNTDSIRNDQKVTRKDLQNEVVYTSSESSPIFVKLVFYNSSSGPSSCLNRFNELYAQGKIP